MEDDATATPSAQAKRLCLCVLPSPLSDQVFAVDNMVYGLHHTLDALVTYLRSDHAGTHGWPVLLDDSIHPPPGIAVTQRGVVAGQLEHGTSAPVPMRDSRGQALPYSSAVSLVAGRYVEAEPTLLT